MSRIARQLEHQPTGAHGGAQGERAVWAATAPPTQKPAAAARWLATETARTRATGEAACSRLAAAARAAAALAAGLGVAGLSSPSVSCCATSDLEPEALHGLALDLASGPLSDRERAVSIMSGITIYLEHHAAVLKAGVLKPAMAVVTDTGLPPKLRSLALQVAADLMKNPEARTAAANDKAFLDTVITALGGNVSEGIGADGDDVTRSHAARLLAELAGQADLHGLLVKCGAAAVLTDVGPALAEESASKGKTYSDMTEVPANVNERGFVEEARFVAAALFALAGSAAVQPLLAKEEGRGVRACALWARSHDPVLRRYGIGALARFASTGPNELQIVASTPAAVPAGPQEGQAPSALSCLVQGLTCDDPQAQCYAAGAIGRIAGMGESASRVLPADAVALQLLAMLDRQEAGDPATAPSAGVERGVYRCALRAMDACARDKGALQVALKKAGAAQKVGAAVQAGKLDSPELKQLASQVAQLLAS